MDAEEISWQLMTFFAANPTGQLELFSQLAVASCEYSSEEYVSARLKEAAKLLCCVKNSFFDSAELVDGGPLNELHALTSLMLRDLDAEYWSVDGLESSQLWGLVRRLARLSLHESGLDENPPLEWFPVDEILNCRAR